VSASIAPVGMTTLGAGLWGQSDLVGNASQWTMDLYVNPYVNPCTDCAYLGAGNMRIVRGGSFVDPLQDLWPSGRSIIMLTGRGSGLGIRCARVP
jgi:formylglycine-generating enzyme required for sulfatase activity